MGLMEGSGLTSSDVLALTKNDEDGFMNGNGMWVFFLFFLLAWGNNGLWGNRGGAADSAAVQGALTRADLCESFNFNDLQRQTQGLANGLCDGFYAQNTTMMQGFHGVDNALCQGFNGVNASITGLGYAMKDCCCETNRNIDAVRYENAKNTCDITTNANFNTRDIIENQNMGI